MKLRNDFLRRYKDKKCVLCKKNFQPWNSFQKWCSRECARKGNVKKNDKRVCVVCKKYFKIEVWSNVRHCSRDCFFKKEKERRLGKGNPNFKHGRGVGAKEWEQKRLIPLERDGKMCVLCGSDGCLAIMHVHHIIPRSSGKPIHDKENLITLCHKCHGVVELAIPLFRPLLFRLLEKMYRYDYENVKFAKKVSLNLLDNSYEKLRHYPFRTVQKLMQFVSR